MVFNRGPGGNPDTATEVGVISCCYQEGVGVDVSLVAYVDGQRETGLVVIHI